MNKKAKQGRVITKTVLYYNSKAYDDVDMFEDNVDDDDNNAIDRARGSNNKYTKQRQDQRTTT
jgi:hypothetical protein